MILIDTSAWIEYLRKTGSAENHAVRRALRDDSAATTDMVLAEVLAGTTLAERVAAWERLLGRCEFLPQEPRMDAEAAAGVYRDCRRGGETLRAVNDCLIAAVAIRHDVPVLHRDKDFDVIARHTTLQVVQP
ncbi:MAG TPA: PIN domain nuclease [Jatrophihabitantaceae bacterium]|jgi:hypothetical protein